MESLAPLQTDRDAIRAAVMTDDWPACRAGLCLPLHLIKVADSLTLTTEPELRAAFDSFRQSLVLQRVTDFIRRAEGSVHPDEKPDHRPLYHAFAGGQSPADPAVPTADHLVAAGGGVLAGGRDPQRPCLHALAAAGAKPAPNPLTACAPKGR